MFRLRRGTGTFFAFGALVTMSKFRVIKVHKTGHSEIVVLDAVTLGGTRFPASAYAIYSRLYAWTGRIFQMKTMAAAKSLSSLTNLPVKPKHDPIASKSKYSKKEYH
jgi:hypothetical protein